MSRILQRNLSSVHHSQLVNKEILSSKVQHTTRNKCNHNYMTIVESLFDYTCKFYNGIHSISYTWPLCCHAAVSRRWRVGQLGRVQQKGCCSQGKAPHRLHNAVKMKPAFYSKDNKHTAFYSTVKTVFTKSIYYHVQIFFTLYCCRSGSTGL